MDLRYWKGIEGPLILYHSREGRIPSEAIRMVLVQGRKSQHTELLNMRAGVKSKLLAIKTLKL